MNTRYWYWIWRTFLGPSRLRRKFMRTFLVAGLVPLILMGAVSAYLVNKTHRLDVVTLEHTIAERVVTDVNTYLDELASAFELTVAFNDFAPISFASPDQQAFILEDIFARYPSVVDASFVCLTPAQCAVGMETRRLTRSATDAVAIDTNRDVSELPFFAAAKEGVPYVSSIVYANSATTIVIAKPVKNGAGQTIAVLAGTTRLDPLQTIVARTTLGETGYAFIRDSAGTVIAHPDAALIGTNTHAELDGTTYQGIGGQIVTGVRHTIGALDAEVVVEWPRAETQATINTILYQIIGFTIFAFLLLAVLAAWTALRLIQPIAELRQGTSVIGGGNFNYRVQIKTGDELEDLGANLNKMAQSLKGLEEVRELRLRTDLLAESLRKEQEVNKLKDQFITTVSHQFNTPLTVINWALDSLRDPKVAPAKLKETTDAIAKSQHDIVAIVADLLTLSQIGFQYQKTNTKSIAVKGLLEKVIAQFSDIVKSRSITLTFESAAASPTIEGNEFTLTKVFENIIDNAVGYSDDGDRIGVSITDTDKDVTVSVTDTGIGIPEGDQPQIFQQFFRAKNATAKKNVGTGLGLFIVKNVVSGHGGKVWFESKENEGSAFHVTLPKR